MPITPENRKRYPQNWPTIRKSILKRAGHCCEWCKLPNYAVGYRNETGAFVPATGNGPVDAIGRGRTWPNQAIPATYAEAREHADDFNFNDDRKWIVIVLTIAHVHDDSPENCDPLNLAALCQRCHNKHDAPARAKRRKEKRDQRQPTLL